MKAPYRGISLEKKELLDYSFWYLPGEMTGKLHTQVKRIDLRELYATIYLNLYSFGIITEETEPILVSGIPLIKEWKALKSTLTKEEREVKLTRINSLWMRMRNKWLLHGVLTNLFTPLLFNKSVIYIDGDVIYLTQVDEGIVRHLNSVYGEWPSELTITDIDFLLIKRHKLICEKTGSSIKTNLDRLSIHRSSVMMVDSEEIKTEFTYLVREMNLLKLIGN